MNVTRPQHSTADKPNGALAVGNDTLHDGSSGSLNVGKHLDDVRCNSTRGWLLKEERRRESDLGRGS